MPCAPHTEESVKKKVLGMLADRGFSVSPLMGAEDAYIATMDVVRHRHALACGLKIDSDYTLLEYSNAVEYMQKIQKLLKHHFDFEAQVTAETFENERAYFLRYTIYFPN